MKLGIMQPYFFPYLGYFQLIHAVDRYVFLDTTQYVRRSWMNRNRIINLKEGTTYITVPLMKSSFNSSLKDQVPGDSMDWRNVIISQLGIYRKRSPYFNHVMDMVKSVLYSDFTTLSRLNMNSVEFCLDYLGISFKYDVFSKMEIDLPDNLKGDECTLFITKALGYCHYVNAPGGVSFYDKEKYSAHGVTLSFLQPNLKPYIQKIDRFESGLSIIDVLMFNSINDVKIMLSDYSFF